MKGELCKTQTYDQLIIIHWLFSFYPKHINDSPDHWEFLVSYIFTDLSSFYQSGLVKIIFRSRRKIGIKEKHTLSFFPIFNLLANEYNHNAHINL